MSVLNIDSDIQNLANIMLAVNIRSMRPEGRAPKSMHIADAQ